MEGLGPPQRIGKYTVDSVLGQGGMGVVYKAHDNYRRVAIKMMLTTLSSNPKLMGRFHREAQLTALLEHPNIVIVHDWGEQDGAPYLVMQYLEGSSLDACRFDVPPTMALLKKLRIVSQVCAGLHYAHCQKMEVEGKVFNGIVHRDIKPANIFVLDNGNETVKLLDFGIAHLGLDGEGGERPMTRTGQLIGSLVYMSPEQANGARLDTRTDIFSLGVVLYELVAGVRPFEGHDTISTITRILTSPPPPIEHYLPDCPAELIELILRALEKSPRDRYQTAEELAFDLSLIETQLRRQLAKEQLELAESAMERSDWVKALEILIELLKLDGEHVRGLSMHREVQQILRRQRRVEDAARLKAKATEKLEMRQFKDALRLAEEAIGLDDSNYDLIVFRDDIRKSLQRSERSRLAAERAENNLRSDRLPAAASSLDEAFRLDPENTQALNLRPRVEEALAEQNRRAQFQSLLRNVEDSLTERRYKSALDFLDEARVLKPDASELDALTSRAEHGQEQERRRQELKARGEEVGALLAAGSLDQAGEKLSAAMRSYPGEPSLQELEGGLARLRREGAVRVALERAENCLREQRLADAQAAVDEALSVDPSSSSAQQVSSRVSAAVAEQARRAQLQLLIQRARECLSRQRYDEALEHLRAAESIDANNDAHSQEVTGLIEQAVQGQEQERRRQELKDLGEEVAALLAAGSLGQGEEKLSAALQSYPGEPSLLELEGRLAHLRREEAVGHALGRAETGLAEQRLEDAQAALDEVFSLDSANQSAQRIGARIAAAIAERARQEQLQILLQQARESLAQQHYSDALNHLSAARGLDANVPEVAALIEQAEQGQEQERRRQELKFRGGEIGSLLAAGSIDQAGEKLSAALRSYPDEPSLLELERTLWQLRRAEGVRRALERAEKSLEEQRLEDAQAAVEEALLLAPDNSNAQQVEERVSAAFAERAKRAQLQVLLQHARESLAQQRYGDALNHLRAAQGIDPDLPEVAALMEQAVQGQEQERRRQELKSLGEEAGALLAAGNLDQAGEKLSAAISSYPGEPSLAVLEDRLLQLRREAAVRLAVERAETSIREQRLADAQAAVDEALSLDPANPSAQQVGARISAVVAEQTRRAQLRAACEDVAALLAAQSLDQAAEKLSAALRSYPGEPSLVELEGRLSQLRREEAIRHALKRAEISLQGQRLEGAQSAVTEALSLDPAHPGAQQLGSRISAAMAEQARRVQLQILVQQGRESLSQQRYGDALKNLRAAQSQDANLPEVAALMEQAVEGQEQERLRQELEALAVEVRALLAAGRFDQAEEKLSAALRSYPGESSLVELEGRLSQLRREEAIRLALKRAESGLRERRLDDAQTALDEVLALDPAHPSAKPLQPRIERARFKRDQASSLMERASKDIEIRRYTSALDLLKQAQGLDAGLAGLDGLVQRALDGQAREKRQRTIDALDEEIRELIAGENFPTARSRMTTALRQFPEEQQLRELDQILTQKQSAAELRQAKLKHEREIFAILKGVRKLMEEGKLSAAQSKLTVAEKRFPEEPGMLELSRELTAKRDQEQLRMLTVAEPTPADADSLWQLQQVSGDHPISSAPSLTQEMEPGPLAARDTLSTGQDALEPQTAALQVRPAIDLTHWQDAVSTPPASEIQPSPPKQFTVFGDDFVPVQQEASAVEFEPPPPVEVVEPVASVAARAAVKFPPEALPASHGGSRATLPTGAKATQPQPARLMVWGAAAVVVLGGIVYGVMHRSSSTAKTEPPLTAVPVNIITTPVGAKVEITGNGQSQDCVTPLCALSLPAGSYQAKATLSGYEESNRALEIKAGLAPVQMQLTPISLVEAGPQASLVVEIPGVQEASVFIDDKEYKATGSELRIPANLHKTYQIQVKKDGYQPSAAEPFTLAHSTEKLVVRLKELPNAAMLVLEQSTPNADVLIDDQSAGRLSSSGRFRTTVPPGMHKIQLSLDGRASDAGSRQFDPRGRVTLSLNVPPPPMVAKAPIVPPKLEPAQATAPAVVAPPSAAPDVSKTLWESIRDTTDPGVLTKFGNQYPEYADRVRERVTALDQKTWDQAKDSGDERRLKAYLAGFPDGKYASNAREAIEASHKNTEEAGVRQALENFSHALDAMSMDQLRQVWPTIGKKQADGYGQLFSAASKIHSRLNVSSLKVNGDTAEVESVDAMVVTVGGRSQNSAPAMKIRLRKTASGWVIDQVI